MKFYRCLMVLMAYHLQTSCGKTSHHANNAAATTTKSEETNSDQASATPAKASTVDFLFDGQVVRDPDADHEVAAQACRTTATAPGKDSAVGDYFIFDELAPANEVYLCAFHKGLTTPDWQSLAFSVPQAEVVTRYAGYLRYRTKGSTGAFEFLEVVLEIRNATANKYALQTFSSEPPAIFDASSASRPVKTSAVRTGDGVALAEKARCGDNLAPGKVCFFIPDVAKEPGTGIFETTDGERVLVHLQLL